MLASFKGVCTPAAIARRVPQLVHRNAIITFATPFRFYTHESSNAPANLPKQGSDAESGAYSRHTLMAQWHSAARQVTPEDLRWEGRDTIQADCKVAVVMVSPTQEKGKIERPTEPLRKQQIIDQFGLQPRDLRSLDAHILDVRPALLVCKGKSIVLCTPIVRAIIGKDRIILIARDQQNSICDPNEAEELVEALQRVMRYVEAIGSASGNAQTPFELRALEALLLVTIRGFKNVVNTLHDQVYRTIPQLRFGVSPAELRHLMESKRTCEDALFSGRALQSAISAVLSEDEDLAGMYISDKESRSISDHQVAELLLEYYERRLDETNESSMRLSSLLSDVDKNISLVLASTRVKLQNLELQTAITTLALGAGATIGSFFGMNLVSGYEEDPSMFYTVTYSGIGAMAFIMSIGWFRLVRNRRSQLFLRSGLRQQEGVAHSERPQLKSRDAHQSKKSNTPGEKKDGTEL